MELRQTNPRKQGDIGEVDAISWLTRAGFGVWIPVGYSPDADLVAERDSRVFRVQVKTCTSVNKKGRWAVVVCTRGGNQSWNKIVKRFSASRCDFLFVLTGDMRRWFIPASVEIGRASCRERV